MRKAKLRKKLRPSARVSDWRLLTLATRLMRVKEARFNFSSWVGDDWAGAPDLSCGTTACAVGLATTIPAFRRAGLRLVMGRNAEHDFVSIKASGYPKFGRFTRFEAARAFFGITYDQAEHLFHPMGTTSGVFGHVPGLGKNASPKAVAQRIREFVESRRKWRRLPPSLRPVTLL